MKLIWKSPTPYNKGASQEQKDLAAEQAKFYTTLTASFATQFANQNAILSSLQDAFGPILKAGIGQYGFTTAEDTALRTGASDAIARNFASAQTALNENLASRGGGNVFLPSGATAQLEAGLLGTEATEQATASNAITREGFALGRQNFLSAAGVLGGAANMYNPTGYISGANTAGSNAFESATTVFKENQAAGGILGGILGGAAQIGLGFIPGIGPALSGALGASGGVNLGSSLGGLNG